MRGAVVAVLILTLISMPLIIESSDADKPSGEPSEPAILCYYVSGWRVVDTFYVLPEKAIGDGCIPYQAGINYWVRMDTGEVVTAESVFEPGTYMIKGYTEAPEPWGKSEGTGSSIDLGMIALIIAVIDLVGIGYLLFRRK